MKISVLKTKLWPSHLTQTEKKHIKLMFAKGITEAKINRKTYRIEVKYNNEYKVYISEVTQLYNSIQGKWTKIFEKHAKPGKDKDVLDFGIKYQPKRRK